MQQIVRKLDELEEARLTSAHVRVATLVRLPFHLCTGKIFHVTGPDNSGIEIWLRSKLSTPHDADIHQVLGHIASLSFDDHLTDALILNHQPVLRPNELGALKNKNSGAIIATALNNPGFRLLNEVVAAHQLVRLGPYVSGMGALWPRMLTQHEMFERTLAGIILLAEPQRKIDNETILALLSNVDSLSISSRTGGAGDLRDYSDEQLGNLKLSISKIRSHAFYELKTSAVAAMLTGDSIVAIVLGCAALEGVHGAFLRLVLRDKVPGSNGEFNKFLNGLLREYGFYSLVQLSVRVLMQGADQPSDDELRRCLEGVTIRNAIMHAGIKGTGEYKLREFSPSQINDGYSGIMKVYKAFEAAVETQEK